VSDAGKVQARTQHNNALDSIVITLPDWWISLQGEEHADVYLLVDCAGLERGAADLPPADIARNECLFTGDLAEELADVSGYLLQLVTLSDETYEAVEPLMQRQSAMVVVIQRSPPMTAGNSATPPASTDFQQLHRHFRKFNVVYGAEGQPLFFRYYDPRVLPGVLKVLDDKQLAAFFGPLARLILPDPDQQTLEYSIANGQLVERALPVTP